MRTGNHGITVRAGESQPDEAPGDLARDELRVRLGPVPSGERTTRRLWVLSVVAGLVVAVAAVAIAVVALTRGDDDVVVRGAAPAAAQPAAPAPLALTVVSPDSVAVGEIARFTATWSDGSGTFSGSTEDWGDEVATSSRKQGRCENGAAMPQAASGTYDVGHVWTAPGSYTVVLGVATFVCVDGAAVVDEVAEPITVTVVAAEDS